MSAADADDDEAPEPEAEHLVVRRRAMNMLARREHAPAELAAKLEKRDHDRAIVARVIEELVDDGLVSAARYADAIVASRAARGTGPLRIRAELATVEVSEAEIERALADADIDWPALAASARCKRFGSAVPDDFPARAKQMRFLQRRGFDAEQIGAAIDG